MDKAVEISGDCNNFSVILIDSGTVCELTAKASIRYIKFANINEAENIVDESLVKVSSGAVFNNCNGSVPKFQECEIYNCYAVGGYTGSDIELRNNCAGSYVRCRIHGI